MEKLLEKLNLSSKKGIENLVIFLVLLIIVMIITNSLFEEKSVETVENIEETKNIVEEKDDLEEKLENILSSIKGVENAKVMISYTNSVEKVPLYDTKETTTLVEEKDTRRRRKKNKRGK